MPVERWPPVHDAQELGRTIHDLANRDDLDAVIYDRGRAADAGPCCQGDIIELSEGVPLLDENCTGAVLDDFTHWLVIGNTCDFARAMDAVRWTQVVPIIELLGATPQHLEDLRRYRLSRQFFVPQWAGSAQPDRVMVADLLRPCALDRRAIAACARVVARLSFRGWLLLNACLVRFLARDDGRFD